MFIVTAYAKATRDSGQRGGLQAELSRWTSQLTIAFVLLRLTVCASVLALSAAIAANVTTDGYVGPEVCGRCHKDVAKTQSKTAMAQTWVGLNTPLLPSDLDRRVQAGTGEPTYELSDEKGKIVYSVIPPKSGALQFPVDVVVGGERHGLGFLFPLASLDGISLARPALLQARYFWSPARQRLLLAPGLEEHVASSSYENLIGLVLSPEFEKRCLTCHGQPHTLGAGNSGGVRCETCHGPGGQHVQAIAKGKPHVGILDPSQLSAEASIAACGRCHTGFGRSIDAAPEDLLIANQATAIEKSECFIQSRQAFSCVTCHNPHQDSNGEVASAEKVCIGCHSIQRKPHAGICPVNAADNCISCHMPSSDVGPLRLVDHWIRVHPEQGIKSREHADEGAMVTQIRPVREYLRLISVNDASSAQRAQIELENGISFYEVARRYSKDASSVLGGYLGDKDVAALEPKLADIATRLRYGARSGIEQAGTHWVILERLPLDFQWQANQLLADAEQLNARGDRQAAMRKAHEALIIYPQFLRALRLIGTMLAEAGSIDKGANVLRVATHLYPDDARSWSELGLLLGALGDPAGELSAYRRAILLEPDFVAAYLNLGKALLKNKDAAAAADEFRAGLQINPLSAELYDWLSKALAQTGDTAGSAQAMKLASDIDPVIAAGGRIP